MVVVVLLQRNTSKDRRQWYRIPRDTTVATTIPLRTEDMDHRTRHTIPPMELNSPSFDKS